MNHFHGPQDGGPAPPAPPSTSAAGAVLEAQVPLNRLAGQLGPAQWGMAAFLLSEAALFSTLLVTYVTFIGQDQVGPTPREALSLPLVVGGTICLLASSATAHLASRRLVHGAPAMFQAWWAATILLAVLFLAGTAVEWHELIVRHRLTIGRNLFGTTYYTLVGFHALHVTLGVLAMSVVLGLSFARRLSAAGDTGVELVAWYWHFVDVVWLFVFGVVYVLGR